MITLFVMNVFSIIIQNLLFFLPQNVGLGTTCAASPSVASLNCIATSITTSSNWPTFGWLNNYLPLDQMMTAAGVIIGAIAIMATIRLATWAWHLLKP